MSRKRTSPIWTLPKDQLQTLVSQSHSFSAILRAFNLCPENGGGRLRDLKKRLELDGIDYSHITSSNKGKTFPRKSLRLEDVLVEHSTYGRRCLKERLIREGLLAQTCAKCGQGPSWNNEPLVLVLDHKNGVRDDNRLENLRLLCPNCNSQMPTFSGRWNKKNHRYLCCKCGQSRSRKAKTGMCYNCSQKYMQRVRKIQNRPDRLTLEDDVKKLGFLGTGKKYGVSDNCVRKWLRYAGMA